MSTERERLSLLFDTHEDKLYRLARRLTSTPADAEDLLQETFLRAARSIGSIPVGRPNEEAWLTRVLVNVCRDEWRKAGVRRRAAPLLYPPTSAPATAESSLIAKHAVWSALETLAPRRRAIVVLAELDGMSAHDIARLLGLAVMTVRWHLSLARRELRRALAPTLEE